MSFFMDREKYRDVEVTEDGQLVCGFQALCWALWWQIWCPWGIASINGMIVAAVCYLIGHARKNR